MQRLMAVLLSLAVVMKSVRDGRSAQRRFGMDSSRFFTMASWLLVLTLVGGLGTAASQQTPPTENKGLKVTPAASLDLAPEIDGMQGRVLRMRVLTLEPGGVVAVHSHKDRPAVAYVLHGTLTVCAVGGACKEYHEGPTAAEGKDTTHWAENRGTKPMVLLAVDIFKQP